ncbi:MAG: peptidase [Firmicutes bacterium]|nr:peptidase [Bacillota bacterium]
MVELLAPAGSREAFTAALESGADAIYLGGRHFGARQYADNFDDDELKAAIREAHLRGVLVYVTVNTLVDDSEFPELATYLHMLYTAGVDAVIVQDVGVAALARRIVPGLKLHASTQMTVHNLAGVKYLAEIGFDRVVLARELSLKDIEFICRNSSVEIEVFIHGALCISYSGQCLMSSMIGGRSGNRGKCAQPCRLPYTLVDAHGTDVLTGVDAGNYLLSPKDLCGIELLPKFIEAGVGSLKVEGRMKRPEYVAIVVDSYRRSIDAYYRDKQGFNVPEEDPRSMAQLFNRGFTTAYWLERPGRTMMSDRRPNNRGVYVGRVLFCQYKDKQATIKLDQPLAVGDIIDFWIKVGGRTNVTVKSIQMDGKNVESAPAGAEVIIPVDMAVKAGDRVFKTYDASLMEKARAFFTSGSAVRRIPVEVTVTAAVGEPLVVTVRDDEGNIGVGRTDFLAENALKRPLDEAMVAKQLGRLGTTVFAMGQLNWDIKGSIMVPVSELNEARRRAIAELEAARLARYNRLPYQEIRANDILPDKAKPKAALRTKLTVNVDTVDKAIVALSTGADIIMFGGDSFQGRAVTADEYRRVVDMAREQGKKVILGTPRLVTEKETASVNADLELFARLAPDGVSIGNLGLLYSARQYSELVLHGDYSLNIFNSAAIEFFHKAGLSSLTLSPELNFGQIEALRVDADVSLECLVHGYLTLMVSEYCVTGSFLGSKNSGCGKLCQQGEFGLKDRMNERFRVVGDQFCRMHVLNAKELSMLSHVPRFKESGIERIRIEGKSLTNERIKQITRLYREAIDTGNIYQQSLAQKIAAAEHEDITRGHYFRGVL